MHDPSDQRFCPHCGFQLNANGGCPECVPDGAIDADALLRLRARHRQRAETDSDLHPANMPASPRDLAGCLPVTPPLGLAAGTMRTDPE